MSKLESIIDKELVCTKCNTKFICSRKRFYKYTAKVKNGTLKTCLCSTCKKKSYKAKESRNCIACGKDTTNPKFCSQSCSAIYTNKMFPKRKKIPRICSCGKTYIPISGNNSTLCNICLRDRPSSEKFKKMTLKDYHIKHSVKGKHPSWKNSHIRCFNRSWNRNLLKKSCEQCGYNKHIELCHIKAVTKFPETATLGEVNSPENNKVLCPNCHWEFDHGLLSS